MTLTDGATQPAPELLGEHRRRSCWPQQKHAINVGHIYALTQNLDREHAAKPAGPQCCELSVTLVWRIIAGQRNALKAGLRELQCHIASVLLRDAETEPSHSGGVKHDSPDGLEKFRN